MDHAPRHVPEEIAPDLEDGETLVAATEADHRSTGGAVVGFIFSGLFSNLVSKAEENDEGDEELHLPYGPVLVAVTDRRVLLYSRAIDLENGPPKFVVALPPDTIRAARHGMDPLTDTMLIEFNDDTTLVLNLDTLNHSGHVIKGIRALIKA